METINKIYKIFQSCKSVSIDTRTIQPNSIYFALKGENFDGNDFVKDAIEKGCVAAVTSNKENLTAENIFYVPDTLKAFQALANLHRKTLNIPIIAITGTNGKTTTKELLTSVLSKKYRVSQTNGNRNNHIGVPLTLLSMNKTVDIGIVEMGANNIGEIKTLCEIAEPNYGIITNIGKAHLQGFGSIEGVKKTKSELYSYLKNTNGTIFVNISNPILTELIDNYQNVVTYSSSYKAYCIGEYEDLSMKACVKWQCKGIKGYTKSNLIGNYNFENLLAAIAVGNYFNIHEAAIDEAIQNYIPRNNRSQLLITARNTLILDYYNANPTSMSLAILNFCTINKKSKTLILGDMLELGNSSNIEHKKILDLLVENNYKKVYLIGENFMQFKDEYNFHFFDKIEDLIKYFTKIPETNSFILVKGSRGVKLEKCIDYL